MSTSSIAAATPASAVRPAGDRATSLELFFDLVYVFAFTQVTHLMAAGENLNSVLGGVAVLGVLWWSWASHAWLANQNVSDRGVVRTGILAAIAIVLVLAIAIPEVYPSAGGSHFGALVFASSFVLLSIVYTVVNITVARRNVPLRRQVIRTMSVTIVPVSTALVVGAVLGGTAQIALWLAAVTIEGITVYLTSRDGEWRLPSVAHYAERHGLVVILALGESIISIGLGVTHATLSPSIIAGSLLAITIALEMWWLYFGSLSTAAERHINTLSGVRRAAIATAGTYVHFGIVAGILFVSLGMGRAVEHIGSGVQLEGFGALALTGGLALFLASTSLYAWRTSGRLPWSRLITAAIALSLTPALSIFSPIAALGTAALLPLALVLHGRFRRSRARSERDQEVVG